MKNFTGVVFVVLKKSTDSLKVLESQDGMIWGKVKRFFFGCCLSNESNWHFERAPEPSDIFWENLNISTLARILSGCFSWILTFIQILICFSIVTEINNLQQEKMQNIRANSLNGKLSAKDQAELLFISTTVSGSVFILNFLLKFSIRFISRWELHETQTKLNVSVALKLTIARFMNSSFVLYSVNINS